MVCPTLDRLIQENEEEAAMNQKATMASLTGLLFLASLFAFGGDKTQVKGMINTRTGETLIVQYGGQNVTVVLTDETKGSRLRVLLNTDTAGSGGHLICL